MVSPQYATQGEEMTHNEICSGLLTMIKVLAGIAVFFIVLAFGLLVYIYLN